MRRPCSERAGACPVLRQAREADLENSACMRCDLLREGAANALDVQDTDARSCVARALAVHTCMYVVTTLCHVTSRHAHVGMACQLAIMVKLEEGRTSESRNAAWRNEQMHGIARKCTARRYTLGSCASHRFVIATPGIPGNTRVSTRIPV